MDMEAYYSDMENLDEDELMNYFEQEEMYNYDDTVYQQPPLWQLLDTCVLPVIQQTITTVLPLAVACIVSKLVASLTVEGRSETTIQRSVVHFSSGLFGLSILYNFFHSTMLYLLITAGLGYLVITITVFKCRPLCGICVSASVVLIIILLELFIVDSASWHKVRGSQMIMSMKIISLAFDVSDPAVSFLPDIWQYHGYVFNVGTVIFGPWISFHQYCTITQQSVRPMNLHWLFKLTKSILSALICLVMSTCAVGWLIQDHHWKWLTAYRDAMSFRFSHYFVSYLSTLSLTLNGLGSTHVNGEVLWDFDVTRPAYIEVPRSLVETVSNWNIPMHNWLKNYVFKIARPLGNFVAVLLTYAASSLLHGLNFQLAAVLLSLAFYSYIEHVFRQKLAKIYDACILAKKCKDNCSHSAKWNNPYVLITNLAFGLLSIFHLAYLGLMFDSSSQEEKGYDMRHTLDKWSSLGFLSHWVASGTFLFHLLI
ncbi:Hypothetical predicted protein [Octopus vulgaris]|uniref:Protein-serine O-palmitoleoyltransferase porcupine n=2 Tax=Octopus TaxID=6643 RepID=A0AA36C2C7_OCTVU|nr:Hypothetical predicted protein [Octopus vulgaris]